MADLSQIQIIPSQVEIPVTNGGTTLRGGYTNLSYNQNLLKRLNAVVEKEFKGDLNFFDDESRPVPSIEYLQQLLSQVVIRFDNDPDYYTKRDYYYLIWYLCQSLIYLQETSNLEELKEAVQDLQTDISGKQDKVDSNIKFQDGNVTDALNFLYDRTNERRAVNYDKIFDLDLTSGVYTVMVGMASLIKPCLVFVDREGPSFLISENGIAFPNSETKSWDWKRWDDLGGIEYTEGTSIDITDNKISAVTDQEINVTIPVGGFEKPQTITAGTDITAVLKQLLEVVIGVKAVNPSIKLESKNKTEEYGTKVPIQQIGFALTQGYFEPADSRWNGTKQYMDCAMTSVSVPGGSTFVDSIDGYVEIPEQILTEVKEYKITSNTVSANTVVPNDSNGNPLPEEKGFTGGSVKTSGTTTFTPYYNAFIGGIDVESISELTSVNIRGVTAHQLPVTPTAKTLLNGQPTSNNAKKAILIACPSVYQLISVQSELGTDMTDSFDLKGSVNVKCGEETVSYNCYLCVVHGECKFQTVKLGKV